VERRHEDMLTAKLEEAAAEGHVLLLRSELYQWYGVKKFADGSRRDLANRWDEAVAAAKQVQPSYKDPGKLMMIEHNSSVLLFGEKWSESVRPN